MIADLITRVAEATGPDREIDTMVFALFPAPGTTVLGPAGKGWLVVQREQSAVGMGSARAPDFTASIDAVVALADREMPGAYWHVSGYVTANGGGLFYVTLQPAGASSYSVGGLPNEARARLLAFLRAVQARQAEDATT